MKPRLAWNHGLRLDWSRTGARRGSSVCILAHALGCDGAYLTLIVRAEHAEIRVRISKGLSVEHCFRWQGAGGKQPLRVGADMLERMLLELGSVYPSWDQNLRHPFTLAQ